MHILFMWVYSMQGHYMTYLLVHSCQAFISSTWPELFLSRSPMTSRWLIPKASSNFSCYFATFDEIDYSFLEACGCLETVCLDFSPVSLFTLSVSFAGLSSSLTPKCKPPFSIYMHSLVVTSNPPQMRISGPDPLLPLQTITSNSLSISS